MMTNTETDKNISPLQNSEEHAKIVADLEAQVETKKAKVEEWKNAYLKSEQERIGLKKSLERAEETAEDWKREASAVRKVQAETKQHKETQDFLTEYQKLQQKKGWQYDETSGWTKMSK
jgi:hypothetical protein